MTIEQALIQRAQPRVVSHKLKELIGFESCKGCIPTIWPRLVRLEPSFMPISELNRNPLDAIINYWEPDEPTDEREWTRLRILTSEDQEPDWRPLERFVKQLKLMSFRIGFEIIGNSECISTSLLVNRRDLPIISVIFESEFEFCKLTPMENDIFPCQSDKLWESLIFKDFFPTPPYSELLTRPMELHYSPLKSLVLAIAKLKDPTIGFYQVLTRAVQADHDWHRNVEILKDLQFNTKLHGNYNNSKSYNQQSPSGDLKMMALEIENKAHNDKPFFCVAVRVGVFDSRDEGSQALNTLTASIGLFQHGGRSLNFMSEQDYEVTLQPIDIQKMFRLGLTYRPGFLINSLEHIGFIDFLYFENYEMLGLPIKQLDKLQVKNAELVSGNGTIIGIGTFDGNEAFVRFGELESKPSVMIGKTGFGKSTLILNRSLYEIQRGHGVAIIEPHNDLTDDILERIPEQHQDRVIYLDPGDLDFVPLFNPFDRSLVGHNIGPATDNIIQGIKSFVSPTGWGARTEHLFRNIIFSLLHLPNSTFFDVSSLLRNDSKESKAFSKTILEVLENDTARQFWKYDYHNLKKDELGPPRNKMSQLLLSGTPALMLSQPENKINFRKIMDEGYILLVNLSNVGPILRGVLGCFILSQFHMAALSRSKLPVDERRPFSIYVDEAYRFMTDTIEDLLVEPRKYNVRLNFAHQYLLQFDKRKIDALSNAGSSIIFNVGKSDAAYLANALGGLVDADDLTSLSVGEAIARIGTDVVRIKTIKMPAPPKQNYRDSIIAASREKYYKPLLEVKKRIKARELIAGPLVPGVIANADPGEFCYDEFQS